MHCFWHCKKEEAVGSLRKGFLKVVTLKKRFSRAATLPALGVTVQTLVY